MSESLHYGKGDSCVSKIRVKSIFSLLKGQNELFFFMPTKMYWNYLTNLQRKVMNI